MVIDFIRFLACMRLCRRYGGSYKYCLDLCRKLVTRSCPDGRDPCGEECCATNEICRDGRCIAVCPPNLRPCPMQQAPGMFTCCGEGEDCCEDGECARLAEGQSCCEGAYYYEASVGHEVHTIGHRCFAGETCCKSKCCGPDRGGTPRYCCIDFRGTPHCCYNHYGIGGCRYWGCEIV